MSRTQSQVSQYYGIEGWSCGYFGISNHGNIEVKPFIDNDAKVELLSLVKRALKEKAQTPLIIRFPQIIKSQLSRLHDAFENAMKENNYKGHVRCVFPFKVNQRKEFIDIIVESGRKYQYGLEVGTKAELLAALSYDLTEEALFICNGFKDSKFIELAFEAKKLGKKIILVIEGTDELKFIIKYAKKVGYCLDIGLRAKLLAKGSGLWEKSSGQESKFGLNNVEIMESLELLDLAGFKQHLVMLHYHVGSQVTEIKKFKNAVKEAARVYAKIHKNGFHLKYLNIGGGIGVDYDGSQSSYYLSANYNIQEFANDVVYIVQDVCKAEKCPCPTIVSESGRVIAAYHSILITDIREVEKVGGNIKDWPLKTHDHKLLHDLMASLNYMTTKNFVEFYHDALQYKEELFTLFNLGYLEIQERAKTEVIFNEICHTAFKFYKKSGMQLEEFEELQKNRIHKYLANFSIFQSIPDSISIDQLFPVMPITRLNEKLEQSGVIMDLTCDSDGCLSKFVDKRDVKKSLLLHTPKQNEPYFIGFFLVGAYQEALGNNHNLFGAVNEVIVSIDKNGNITQFDTVEGEDVGEILRIINYDEKSVIEGYKKQLNRQLKGNHISKADYDSVLLKIKSFLSEYPYLMTKEKMEIVG